MFENAKPGTYPLGAGLSFLQMQKMLDMYGQEIGFGSRSYILLKVNLFLSLILIHE